jgi:hypothetical protein
MELGSPESKPVNDPYSAERKAWEDVPSDKLIQALESWHKLLSASK